jgi:Kiwa protein KwaB-like
LTASSTIDAAQRALSAASSLGHGETQILLFASARSGSFGIRRVNPTQRVANKFRDVASSWATDLRSRVLVPYSAGRTPSSHELAFLPLGGNETLEPLLASMESPIEIEVYADAAFAKRLRFYVVAVKVPNPGWIYFFKAKGETLRLKKTRKVALVPAGNAFDELESDPLIFDDTFDAVISNGHALIVNQASFERALQFVEQASAAATATLNGLLTNLAVANADAFRAAAAADVNMIAKLRSIAEKLAATPSYAKAMTTESLIKFAEARGIAIDTKEVDGERQFVFLSDPQHRWRILKLLDDDYLHSPLTELDYEANSKIQMA